MRLSVLFTTSPGDRSSANKLLHLHIIGNFVIVSADTT